MTPRFLGSLRYKREELAAAGVHITNKEYQRTVLKGIPEELARFASGLLSSARLVHRASSIDTETLIDHICEEADRLRNRWADRGKPQSSQSGAKSQAAGDDALAATGSEGNKKKRRKGKCHNCGKSGHWARECRSPKKEETPAEDSPKPSKAQKSDTKPVGSANAVATPDEDADGCWAMVLAPRGHDLEDFDLIDESDWLSEEEEVAAAVITTVSDDRGERVELYDSGATRHISPYKSDFSSYTPLDPPIYLNAANQQRFPAVGVGRLSVLAPNGGTHSTITLSEVLHAPAVGYTLVSIGALDQKGYRTSIGGGHLELYAPGGGRVARVSADRQGPVPCHARRGVDSRRRDDLRHGAAPASGAYCTRQRLRPRREGPGHRGQARP